MTHLVLRRRYPVSIIQKLAEQSCAFRGPAVHGMRRIRQSDLVVRTWMTITFDRYRLILRAPGATGSTPFTTTRLCQCQSVDIQKLGRHISQPMY